jgi:ribosomal protein S12 methylthiotransferase
MKRGMTWKSTYALIEKLRARISDLAIRTTFLVGYPGESNRDFEELLTFMKWAHFDRLGMFVYSREDGTSAASLGGQVPDRVKQERFHEGMILQQRISAANNERLIGKTFSVLIEGRSEDEPNTCRGRSCQDAPEVDGCVYVRAPKGIELSEGDFVLAQVQDSKEYDLTASFLKIDDHT